MHRRGIALVLVLIMTSLLFMMVLALYISSRGGLFATMSHQRHLAALYVAEAGLADAMDALEASNFALTSGVLTGTLPGVGGRWEVEFRDSGPFLDSHSVNNLGSDAAAESYRGLGSVRGRSALIIVRAQVGDAERVLEASVTRSAMVVNTGRAIQSGGTLRMSGNVHVDGIRSLEDATAVGGNIHSNGAAGMVIEWDGTGSADISGSVSSVAAGGGAIDLNGYLPGGGVSPGASVAPFPVVNIAGTVAGKSASPTPAIPPVGATTLPSGDFYLPAGTVINGDLELNGSNLYVNGSLTVNGSIVGSGSVYATGDTSLQGSSSVLAGSGDQVALFSGGDLTLTGFNGNQYLDALAAIDPAADNYLDNSRLTLNDMQSQLNNPAVNLFANSNVDRMRRTLGHSTSTTYTYMGRPADCLGQLALRIEANQPVPSPTRDFLLKKLDDLSGAYNQGQPYGNQITGFFANITSPDTPASVVADHLANGRIYNLVDAINDNAQTDLADELQQMLNWIGDDGLGNAYFRGLVYCDGSITARNDVTVVGSLMSRGDINLQNGVRVTFVEDLFQDATASSVGGLVVTSWIGR